ncbi:glycosyltransferase [Candidatus Woesearchaeota archaeon]|nr:glycosyltransferase [Candidatus Woesearchaeota archaeon]
MKISIIIPALNEEKYIGKLLTSISKQDFRDYEVIVADAGSSDKTVEISRKLGARIIKGGSPAEGRNNGAKVAKGEFLFFFDADVKLPPKFLSTAYEEIQESFLDLATCRFVPISNMHIDKVMHNLAFLTVKLGRFYNPHAPGFCIFITKRLFDKVEGFNDELMLGEDHDLVKRASVYRPIGILENTHIYVSVRRLRKEGRFTLVKKYIMVELHRTFKGEVKENIVDYDFGDFDNLKSSKTLEKVERQINIMNIEYNKITKFIGDQTSDYKNKVDKAYHKYYRLYQKLWEFLKTEKD